MLLHLVAPTQPLDASLAVHYPLLPGVKGMTLAAHLNTKGGLGGARLEGVAAGARHSGIVELGMNICFHSLSLVTCLAFD